MNLKQLKIKLHNAKIRIAATCFGVEPECCGYFQNPDGKLVECNEWWGYQDCMFPGCGHYQLEHSDGTPNKIIYAKDHPELVGTLVVDPVGCLNAGCEDCPKFWTKEDLHNFMQLLARARHHATHDMHRDGEQCDLNVTHVDTSVSVVVQVTTSVTSRDRDALNRVFEREGKLRDKFPDILFNFDVRFEPQEVKASISE
jgi:hypothetical protein